jgi:hypothetical protein
MMQEITHTQRRSKPDVALLLDQTIFDDIFIQNGGIRFRDPVICGTGQAGTS